MVIHEMVSNWAHNKCCIHLVIFLITASIVYVTVNGSPLFYEIPTAEAIVNLHSIGSFEVLNLIGIGLGIGSLKEFISRA